MTATEDLVVGDLPALDIEAKVAELAELRAHAVSPSRRATERQHAKGKLTVRERIDLLFDEGTFHEIDQLRRHRATGFGLEDRRPCSDGVVTGWGQVFGRRVFVYAHDFRIFGGSLGEAHAAKIHKLMDLAESMRRAAGVPFGRCGRADPGGRQRTRRVRRDLPAHRPGVWGDPADQRAARPVRRRGPLPALTDFVFMVRDIAHMYLMRPGRRPLDHRRGHHPRAARRRGRARRAVRRGRVRLRHRGRVPRRGPAPDLDAAA